MDIPLTLTYDDVLLVPLRSRVRSRGDVDTGTFLTRNIRLKIPIVSANMDTVTESAMAIAMAQAGGIGIIHRFTSIERQVREVMRVKRNQNIIIEEPFTVRPDNTIAEVREAILQYRCSGFLVADSENKLLGIVSKRDIVFVDDNNEKVSKVMTPFRKLIVANPGIDLQSARDVMREHKIEKLPLVDSNNCIKGLITAADIIKSTRYANATRDVKGRLRVGGAIGVKNDYLERASALMKADVDVLVVDIAHGHSDNEMKVVMELKERFPDIEVIGGNIATEQAAIDLINCGVDAVKVGIGGGSICITRVVAGVGIPVFSSVRACARVCKEKNVPIIADQGIRHPGDVTKALAAGASTVMIGGLLAGTDESPGPVVTYRNKRFKICRGMASLTASIARPDKQGDETFQEITPEGIESRVPYRGPVEHVLAQLIGGLRSGMSYINAMTISEMHTNARFVRTTNAGLKESHSHDNEEL